MKLVILANSSRSPGIAALMRCSFAESTTKVAKKAGGRASIFDLDGHGVVQSSQQYILPY